MRRNFMAAFVAMVFALATVAWFGLRVPAEHRIDRSSFDLIELGMTEADVQAIIGVPYGQHFRGTVATDYRHLGGTGNTQMWAGYRMEGGILLQRLASGSGKILLTRKGWVGDRLGIWIDFDGGGKVSKKEAYVVLPADETLSQTLRRWLDL